MIVNEFQKCNPGVGLNGKLTVPSVSSSPFPGRSGIGAPAGLESGSASQTIEHKVLFAGLDPSRFQEVQRAVRQHYPRWLCHLATQVDQVSEILGTSYFDAVVVDARLAEVAGFLEGLATKAPRTLRLVLTDASVAGKLPQQARVGTEFLRPDTEAITLVENLSRSLCVQRWMSEPSMRKLLASIRKLPTLPRLHTQIVEKLRDPEGTLEEV